MSDIFENNCLGQLFKNQNQKNIITETEKKSKTEEKKSKSGEKKNTFKILDISKESTIQIDSSYENINKITNFSYISDDNLRKRTKQFLLEQCTLELTGSALHKEDIKKSKSISPNHKFYKSEYDTSNDKIKSIDKNKINKKRKSFLGSIPELFNFKFPKLKTAKNCNSLSKLNNTIVENDSNTNLDKNLYGDISSKTHSDKNITNKHISNTKKFKKNKEIEVISNNIKRNTQNLNNPQLFYTDLFHNIIEKQKKRNSLMKRKNKKSGKLKK